MKWVLYLVLFFILLFLVSCVMIEHKLRCRPQVVLYDGDAILKAYTVSIFCEH